MMRTTAAATAAAKVPSSPSPSTSTADSTISEEQPHSVDPFSSSEHGRRYLNYRTSLLARTKSVTLSPMASSSSPMTLSPPPKPPVLPDEMEPRSQRPIRTTDDGMDDSTLLVEKTRASFLDNKRGSSSICESDIDEEIPSAPSQQQSYRYVRKSPRSNTIFISRNSGGTPKRMSLSPDADTVERMWHAAHVMTTGGMNEMTSPPDEGKEKTSGSDGRSFFSSSKRGRIMLGLVLLAVITAAAFLVGVLVSRDDGDSGDESSATSGTPPVPAVPPDSPTVVLSPPIIPVNNTVPGPTPEPTPSTFAPTSTGTTSSSTVVPSRTIPANNTVPTPTPEPTPSTFAPSSAGTAFSPSILFRPPTIPAINVTEMVTTTVPPRREPSLATVLSANPSPGTVVLEPGERLLREEYVTSPSGEFQVGLNRNGDLILMDKRDNMATIWSAGIIDGNRCSMQEDGNLVIRDSASKIKWTSNTDNNPGARFVVNDAGQVGVFEGDLPLWMAGIPRGVYAGPSSGDISFPVRGAFYYPWYPETWTVNGKKAKFEPDLGFYSVSSWSPS